MSALLIFTMALGIFTLGMFSAAEAKTAESAQAENIFFYVTNKDGKNVLLGVLSCSELKAISHGQLSALMTGTDTGKNYYFSCTDNLPTTAYTEAQGFTLPELIAYVKNHSQVQGVEAIAYTGSDKLYFMATDSNGSYNKNWTYDQLYGDTKYYFPDLFTLWSSDWEISDAFYSPTDTNPIPLDIYNSTYRDGDVYYEDKRTAFANGQLTVPILATKLEMDRTSNLSAQISANHGNVTGCLQNALTSDRALQLCMPQSEAVLMSGNRTAYHYFAWVYNLKLVMADAPDIASLGTVEAPCAIVTNNDGVLSITMNCATQGASIYYSLTDGAPQTLYTGEAVTWDVGDRDLASNPVTFTMAAVKTGYDDAGIIAVTYPQRAPALTDIYTATVGNDVAFTANPAVSTDTCNSFIYNITGASIKYPGASAFTKLNVNQYTVDDSTKTITFDKSLFSTYGSHSFQICADDYANKNMSVTMKKPAPAVETVDYYLGSDLVLSLADADYQRGIAVRVKAEGAAATVPIGSAYLKQSVPGKLTIDKTYYNSANCAITVPGTYILTLTNSNYDPLAQTVPVIVKAASEKPEGDNFVYTLTPSVSKGKVGEPVTMNVALLSDADSYKFYAGEYRMVLDKAAWELNTVTASGKWKSGTRTSNEETILTFAALDETDKGVAGDKVTEMGSFTVTLLQEGTASITCTKALLTDADAQALSNVRGDSLLIDVEAATGTHVAKPDENIIITPNNPITITVPPGVTNTGIQITENTPLPTVNIQSNQVDMTIPEGTQVSGSDTIKLPEVKPSSSVNVAGARQVDLVISVGSELDSISFTKPVRLVLKGQASKSVGFIDNQGRFREIKKLASLTGLTSDTDADAVNAALTSAGRGEGAVASGSDLIVWTKHFTQFVAYTPKTSSTGSTGGSGRTGGSSVTSGSSQTIPDQADTIKETTPPNEEKEPVIEVMVPVKPVLKDINGHWAQASINQLVNAGAVSGYPDGTFQPDNTITRAEFAAILVKAFNLEPRSGQVFSDTSGHWAQDSIQTAFAHGIVSGYDATTFGPDNLITREQMAVMISQAANLSSGEGKTFADSSQIAAWAKAAVAAASGKNIISGYPDNTFRPQANATRAEAVTVIIKALH